MPFPAVPRFIPESAGGKDGIIMKLCYQVATPDVAVDASVTAFQGSLETSFSRLSAYGYDGVELMTLNPAKLDWNEVKTTAEKYGLSVVLVCTGEIFGQLGLSFADPAGEKRREAVARVKEIIDFAAFLGANINIGRVRGQYCRSVPREQTEQWAIVTLMQTNFINTIAQAADMVDRVGRSNFKLMMDVFHLNIEEKDLLQTIREYSPKYNIHVHLADNNRRYPGHCGMDFHKVISAFRQAGYDGVFCTEIFQEPDQETAAQGAIRHLAPIFHAVYGRPEK